MRVEAESAKEALSLDVENFKNSEEFKEEILEDGYAFYCIGYEDGRDTVEKLYPDLNLSSIISSCSGDEAAEEGVASIEDDAPTVSEAVPVVDTAPKQRDGDDDW